MHSFGGYVTPDEVISDVALLVADEEMKVFSKGYHLSQIQQALTELAFDTLFDEQEYIAPVPRSLILDLPNGLINLESVYLFDGNNCGASGRTKVWWANNYFRYGNQMFKDQVGHSNDPIMEDTFQQDPSGHVFFYGRRGSQLHFSDACLGRENIFIKYRGMGCNIGDQPIIPNDFRAAIKNRMAMDMLRVRFAKDPARWREVYADAKKDHHGGNGVFDVGSWKQAMRRIQDADMGTMNDISKYLSNLSLKITR